MTENSIDSVELMRKARERLAEEWGKRPREEEIRYLREKYGRLTGRRRKAVA
jgi:hypothetical protein